MARTWQQQTKRKSFSEMEEERRRQESGREAGNSRPAPSSFSEMEQARRNREEQATVSWIKNRYPETVDRSARRQVIQKRDAQTRAAELLNNYMQGFSRFDEELRKRASGWKQDSDEIAGGAKAEAKRAMAEAGNIRSFLRENREKLGEDRADEYNALLDQYVKGYGQNARAAGKWARGLQNTGEREYRKYELDREAAEQEREMAAIRAFDPTLGTNEIENRKAQEMADYMAAVRRGDVAYDEATAEGIRKKYDDQIETIRQRAERWTGVSGSMETQTRAVRDIKEQEYRDAAQRNQETREKGNAIYGEEIRELQNQLDNTRDPEKRAAIEDRLAEIEYYDTDKRSLLEVGANTALSGYLRWRADLAGMPHRVMETLFPGYADGAEHDYESQTIAGWLLNGKGDKNLAGLFQFLYDQSTTNAERMERKRQISVQNRSDVTKFLSGASTSIVPMALDLALAQGLGEASSFFSAGAGAAEGLKNTTRGYQMLSNMVHSPHFYTSLVHEFAGTWDEEIEKGTDPTTAGLLATFVGTMNAAIEVGFGVEEAAGIQDLPGEIAERLAQGGDNRTKMQILVDWLKDAASEGREEWMQKFVSDTVTQIAEDPRGLLTMYDWKDYAEAFGGGAFVGGLMGGVGQVGEQIQYSGREAMARAAERRNARKEDPRITRYLEELARERGAVSGAEERQGGTIPQSGTEAGPAPLAQGSQDAAPVSEEAAERAAMTPEERAAAAREEREAEADIRTYLEENEERAEDRSEETGATEGPYAVSGTGRIETGSAATIAGVESVKNGEMTYRLSDGNTVSAEDVKYANRGEALVAKTVAGLGVDEKGAAILLREWAPAQTGVSGETYAAGIELAYEYGLRGYRAEEVADNRDLRALRGNQVRAAYELGRIERDERAARSDELLRRNAPTEARSERGGVRIAEGAVIRGENAEAQVKALDAIGKAVGVRIVVYDKEAGEAGQPAENGFYDARDRTVHINLRAGAQGDGIMLNTAAHELTHYIHDTARVEYNKLADFLFSQYGKAGVTLQGMIAEEKQAAANAGRKISDEEAMMEVVADSMETMLSDGTVIEALTRENKSLGQKIVAWIGQIVEKIKRLYKNVGAETIEGRIVEDAIAEGEALRELWTRALRKAGEVGTAAETGTNEEYVSYSVKRVRAADRTSLIMEATAEDVGTDEQMTRAVVEFQGMFWNVEQAEAEAHALENEIRTLEEEGKDQNSDRIQELNEKLYLQSRAVEEGRYNLRKKANTKEMRAIAEKVMQNRIAETEALEEAVPKENTKRRTLSTIEEKAKENATLRKSNEILKRKLAAAKEELTVRKEKKFRREDMDRFTAKLLRDYQNSSMNRDEVRQELEKIGRMMIEGNTAELNEHLREAIRPLAEEIVDGAREKVDFDPGLREKLGAWMRSGVRIPAGYVNDLDPDFRRQNAWWLRISKGDTVDSVYMQLSTEFGETIFPPDVINPADQIQRIAEIWESFKPYEHNPHEGIENAMIESVIQDVVDGMISETMRLEPPTVRERYEAKIAEERRKARESRKELKKQFEKESKEREEYEETLRNNIEWTDRISTIRSIIGTAKRLERDLTGQTKTRVMEKFRKPVAELVAAMDVNMPAYDAADRWVRRLENRIAKAGNNAGYRAKLEQQLSEARRKRDYLERKHTAVYEILKRELGTGDVKAELRKYAERGIKGPLENFVMAYADTQNIQGMEGAYDESVFQAAKKTLEEIGEGRKVADLDMKQLKALENTLIMIRHKVRNGEKLFQQLRNTDVTTMAIKTMEEIGQVEKKREKVNRRRKPDGLAERTEKYAIWDNLKPATAMERIGSRELEGLYEGVRRGELEAAQGGEQAKNFMAAMRKKFNAKKWDTETAHEFKAKHGKTVSLTLPQMMALYAYSKRGDSATVHLSQGGFILQDAIRTVTDVDKVTGKKRKTYKVRDGAAYAMGVDEIAQVVGALTKEQTDYVDAMQKYLSEVEGAKGNNVSLQLYGVRQFVEKNYFPLMVFQAFIDSRLEKTVGESQIRNLGFTKALLPNANSTIVLEGFDDVWSRHVSEMEMYAAFTLPLENFVKVYNYRIHASEAGEGDSVKAQLGRAWGNNATGYIEQLLKDINGQPAQRGIAIADWLMRSFKVAATSASLSTIVQQPTSFWRAMAYIERKYFKPQRISLKKVNELYTEMKRYAPVAILKDMGRFDTGTGRSLREYIQDNQTGLEKVREVFGKGAELADRYTWVQIWEAAKRKAADERKGVKSRRGLTNSEVLNYSGNIEEVRTEKEMILRRAGQIADEAIVKTQVYDSVFTRSQNMRKQDMFNKMATSFMAEPTTNMNQVLSGIWDMTSGRKAYGARKIASAIASAIAAAVASSIVYALRDKDEDKTYAEKLVKHMTGEVLEQINPMEYFPYLRDISSLLQGYSIERTDMTQISNLISAFNKISKGGENTGHNVGLLVGEVANFFGIPAKNLMRDCYGIYRTVQQTVVQITGGEKVIPSMGDIERMAYTGFREAQWTFVRNTMPEADKKDKLLFNAWQSGNEAAKRKWIRQYADEATAEKVVINLLASEDERIGEAARARLSGDAVRYGEIMDEIAGEGRFSMEMAASAEKRYESQITSAASDVKKAYIDEDFGSMAAAKEKLFELAGEKYARSKIEEVVSKANEEEAKESIPTGFTIYKASDVAGALDTYGAEEALEILYDLIEAAGGEAYADTVRKNAKSAITSRMKPIFKSAAESGNRDLMEKIVGKLVETGLYGDRSAVEKTVDKWIG